ncbi:AAA family ATPase [Campylobacter sp. RM16188]|uniref:AAA family ATPase n=1 Tax=Campylobacter sp. RM16188 TaxID=1705725 RepID=UPI001553D8EC|nr:AAA family ATPase [Campylobacter sp. RM16188]
MDIDLVRSELRSFISQTSISQSAIARAIGVSATQISQFLNGKYPGDNESLATEIVKVMRNHNQKALKKGKDDEDENFTPSHTHDFSRAMFVIDDTIEDREMAVIYGEPGTGKSVIMKAAKQKYPNAVLIEATLNTNAAAFLDELMLKLNLSLSGKKANDKHKAIVDFLNKPNTDKVILIDEAEHLSVRSLEDLRRIYDFTQTPIILCGTYILIKNLRGKNGELKQLYSRICGKWVMRGLGKDECEKIFKTPYIFKWSENTNGYANFRISSKLYKKSLKLARAENCEVDEKMVEEASEMMILGDE